RAEEGRDAGAGPGEGGVASDGRVAGGSTADVDDPVDDRPPLGGEGGGDEDAGAPRSFEHPRHLRGHGAAQGGIDLPVEAAGRAPGPSGASDWAGRAIVGAPGPGARWARRRRPMPDGGPGRNGGSGAPVTDADRRELTRP